MMASPTEHPARILHAALGRAIVRTGEVIQARLHAPGVKAHEIRCRTTTPGYRVEIDPERARVGGVVVLHLAITRLSSARTPLCRLRFEIGSDAVMASLTVMR